MRCTLRRRLARGSAGRSTCTEQGTVLQAPLPRPAHMPHSQTLDQTA